MFGPTGSPEHNLPADLSSFVGRVQELVGLSESLSSARLLTLVGAGGVGKTRLALRLAREVLPCYADGVWLVELAPVRDPILVPNAVASTLQVPEQTGRSVQFALVEALRPKQLLLVLDNCEHLTSACAELVAELLRQCPKLQVLATTRESLGISGEVVKRIPSLAFPESDGSDEPEQLASFDSVRLFLERVRSVDPDFTIKPENAPAIATVCRRLDGIPLAVELAAARMNVLSVEQVADRLTDRFGLLSTGRRDAPQRHQTLRAVVDWSYELLKPAEQRMFQRLTAFSGGCELEAVEAVCVHAENDTDSPVDLLSGLIDKSLLITDRSPGVSGARYRMLETLREYAHEQLLANGEAELTNRRHAMYFLALAEEAQPALFGPRQGTWLVRIEREHDNFRAALQWAVSRHEAEIAVRLGIALERFWWLRSHFAEGQAWLTQVLALADEVPRVLRARVLNAAAANAGLGVGDTDRAAILHSEALAIWQEIGDSWGIAWTLHNLGLIARDRGDLTEAERLFRESLVRYRSLDSLPGMISILRNIGLVLCEAGDISQARPLYEESLNLARTSGDSWARMMTANGLGSLSAEQGNFDLARAALEEALTALPSSEATWSLPIVLRGFVNFEIGRQRPLRAAQLLGAAEAIRSQLGAPLTGADRRELERKLAAIHSAISPVAFARAWERGAAMSSEEAIAFAWQCIRGGGAELESSATVDRDRLVSPLSRRESEVVSLVAQGMTNKQIAEKIFVTESTAAKHIEHILDKLGLASRAQIAAWATEHRLRAAET